MSFLRRFGTALVLLLAAALLIVGIWNYQSIYDWWRLKGYDPPARVVQVADRTTMADYSRKVFYVNRPEFQDRESFNQNCNADEQSIVLGCYISGRGTYIFDVTEPRLSGIHEVTAAHEVLHAVYDRHDESEKEKISKMLNEFYGKLDNKRIKETIELYRAKDPSVVPNELHSIIGTEIRKLTPALEEYYGRYFEDRIKIVEYAEKYEDAFIERKNKVAGYDAQLKDLRARIDRASAELDTLVASLKSERQVLDELLEADRTDEYNSRVPSYNSRVREYNAKLSNTRQLIDRFNRIVEERNKVALEEQELIKAIDSRTLPSAQ